jgi:predicted nucleic acid-binding protein
MSCGCFTALRDSWKMRGREQGQPKQCSFNNQRDTSRRCSAIVPGSTELFESGLRMRSARQDKDWSFTDCISSIAMEQWTMQRMLAHDYHFEQAGFEALPRRNPP